MKKTQNNYKKPNAIVYFIYRLICKAIGKFAFNTKIIRNEIKGVKGSYIVLANHESKIDFINLAIASKRRMHLVISNSFYQTISIKPLMDMIQVIPKQQFQTTPANIKKMKRVIDNNVPLAVYPVGLMSENGLSTDPGTSTAKLLKLLNTDVYVCYTEGSYLTQPKWSKVRRKGKITVDIFKLISKEELATISNEDLFKLVRKNIDFDAYENQKKNMVSYKNGNNVVGLEYVLYQCPKCKTIKSIKLEGETKLKCTCCGYTVESDNYGLLNGEEVIFDTPSAWSMDIIKNLEAELLNNPNYQYEDNVTISTINYKKHKYEEAGTGHVSINKDNIILKGIINGEEILHSFYTSTYPTLPFVPGEYLEIQDGQDIYRLKFSDPYNVTIFVNILKIINQSYNLMKK